MKGYTVFNHEQVEGLPTHYYAKPEPRFSPIQRVEHAEATSAMARRELLRSRAGLYPDAAVRGVR